MKVWITAGELKDIQEFNGCDCSQLVKEIFEQVFNGCALPNWYVLSKWAGSQYLKFLDVRFFQ